MLLPGVILFTIYGFTLCYALPTPSSSPGVLHFVGQQLKCMDDPCLVRLEEATCEKNVSSASKAEWSCRSQRMPEGYAFSKVRPLCLKAQDRKNQCVLEYSIKTMGRFSARSSLFVPSAFSPMPRSYHQHHYHHQQRSSGMGFFSFLFLVLICCSVISCCYVQTLPPDHPIHRNGAPYGAPVHHGARPPIYGNPGYAQPVNPAFNSYGGYPPQHVAPVRPAQRGGDAGTLGAGLGGFGAGALLGYLAGGGSSSSDCEGYDNCGGGLCGGGTESMATEETHVAQTESTNVD